MAMDAFFVFAMYYAMLEFRYFQVKSDWTAWTVPFVVFVVVAVVVHLVSYWLAGVYGMLRRYVRSPGGGPGRTGRFVVGSDPLVGVVCWPLLGVTADYPVPRSVVIVGGMAATVASIGLRFFMRVFSDRRAQHAVLASAELPERVLLVGAGQAADMILREIQRTPSLRLQVVGLVDDRHELRNMTIQGFPVLGRVADAPAIAKAQRVTQILVAIPSASAEEVVRIYRLCKPIGVPVKILPAWRNWSPVTSVCATPGNWTSGTCSAGPRSRPT